MRELEQVLGLSVAAVILAAAARRVGAPYPVFLAIGGALLAFLPLGPPQYPTVAGAIVAIVIMVRVAWHMSFNAVVRWRDRRFWLQPATTDAAADRL